MRMKEAEFRRLQEKLKQEELRRHVEGIGLTLKQYRDAQAFRFLEFTYTVGGQQKSTAEIKERIREWICGGWRATPFLILYGRKGTGKTKLAQKLAILLSERHSVYYVDKKELDLRLYDFNSLEEFIDTLKSVDILIVDDFGTGYSTDYKSAYFFQVMNYRYENDLRTILTTNIDLLTVRGDETSLRGEEKDMVLLVDRLREKGCFILFDYPSLRRPEIRRQAEKGVIQVAERQRGGERGI